MDLVTKQLGLGSEDFTDSNVCIGNRCNMLFVEGCLAKLATEFQSGSQSASDYRHGGQPATARDQSDQAAYKAKQYECAIAALQSGQVVPVNKIVQEGFLTSHQ